MSLKKYSSEGVVLSKKNCGEADRILIVYSKHFGQVRLLAKGVRKPKSRKRGHLEIFSHVKFSASAGKGMDLVTEVETLNSYADVRNDLKRVAVGYYLCEVVSRLTREGERNERVFSEIISFLGKLKESNNLKQTRMDFISKMLTILGFSTDDNLYNPDAMLEEVIERKVNSIRVGKALLL